MNENYIVIPAHLGWSAKLKINTKKLSYHVQAYLRLVRHYLWHQTEGSSYICATLRIIADTKSFAIMYVEA